MLITLIQTSPACPQGKGREGCNKPRLFHKSCAGGEGACLDKAAGGAQQRCGSALQFAQPGCTASGQKARLLHPALGARREREMGKEGRKGNARSQPGWGVLRKEPSSRQPPRRGSLTSAITGGEPSVPPAALRCLPAGTRGRERKRKRRGSRSYCSASPGTRARRALCKACACSCRGTLGDRDRAPQQRGFSPLFPLQHHLCVAAAELCPGGPKAITFLQQHGPHRGNCAVF